MSYITDLTAQFARQERAAEERNNRLRQIVEQVANSAAYKLILHPVFDGDAENLAVEVLGDLEFLGMKDTAKDFALHVAAVCGWRTDDRKIPASLTELLAPYLKAEQKPVTIQTAPPRVIPVEAPQTNGNGTAISITDMVWRGKEDMKEEVASHPELTPIQKFRKFLDVEDTSKILGKTRKAVVAALKARILERDDWELLISAIQINPEVLVQDGDECFFSDCPKELVYDMLLGPNGIGWKVVNSALESDGFYAHNIRNLFIIFNACEAVGDEPGISVLLARAKEAVERFIEMGFHRNSPLAVKANKAQITAENQVLEEQKPELIELAEISEDEVNAISATVIAATAAANNFVEGMKLVAETVEDLERLTAPEPAIA